MDERVGTPDGWDAVIAQFGDPDKYRLPDGTLSPSYEHDWIVRIPLPRPLLYAGGGTVSHVAVNRVLVETAKETFAALVAVPAFWSELEPYGGGFEPRLKRGSTKPSLHTMGIAFDFNPGKYPLGSLERMPDELVKVWTDRGWFYGGDFHGRKDPMHFQFARGV